MCIGVRRLWIGWNETWQGRKWRKFDARKRDLHPSIQESELASSKTRKRLNGEEQDDDEDEAEETLAQWN